MITHIENSDQFKVKSSIIMYDAPLLAKQGNFQEEKLNSIILLPTGRPDRLAISIYSDIRSWFRPKQNGTAKLKTRGYQTSYAKLSKQYSCCVKTIKQKIKLLEGLGLISRDFTDEFLFGRRLNNVLNILVWKDTPHFFNEFGLDKNEEDIENFSNLQVGQVFVKEEENYLNTLVETYPDPLVKNYPHHIKNTTLETTLDKTDIKDLRENQGINSDNFIQDRTVDFDESVEQENSNRYWKQNLECNVDIQQNEFKNSEQEWDLDFRKQAKNSQISDYPPSNDKVIFTNQDSNKLWGIPLTKYRYSTEMLEDIRVSSNKQHFKIDRIEELFKRLASKYPDKLIIGGRKGFIAYMTKALNGEKESMQEVILRSIEEQSLKAYQDMEYRLANGNEFQYF